MEQQSDGLNVALELRPVFLDRPHDRFLIAQRLRNPSAAPWQMALDQSIGSRRPLQHAAGPDATSSPPFL